MRQIANILAGPIREEIDRLLRVDFIREVPYPNWISNIVMVKKSTGNMRMCIDFTNLNAACPNDSYPLPNIDAMVDSTTGYFVMSFPDAFFGYHQIKMHLADCENTSFFTGEGIFCYKVMPFGLRNAGAIYQRMMDKVFRDQKGRNIEVYVDDLLEKSRSPEQHLRDFRETFTTLRKFGM